MKTLNSGWKSRILLISATIIVMMVFTGFFYLYPILTARDHFIKNSTNPNVYYEEGAKKQADAIARFIPEAIAIIENGSKQKFKEDFKVYVYRTQKSFNKSLRITSSYPIRGAELMANVLISPSAFDFDGSDNHRESLLHELSHLHFKQHLGFIKSSQLPHWFKEGFADMVSNTGGEGITQANVMNNILSGNHLVLNEKGSIFRSLAKAAKGMSPRMFHKQSRMFVTYIAQSDPSGFEKFILEILHGNSFKYSFDHAMGREVRSYWESFVSGLEISNNNADIQ